MSLTSKFGPTCAFAAAISLIATPVAAAELPYASRSAAVGYQSDVAHYDRRDRDRDRGRYRDRDGIDGGDILAGVLVLGAIAAIASSSKKPKNEPEYRYPDQREPLPRESQGYRSGDFDAGSSGMSRAVDMCVDQIELGDEQVSGVDAASRTAEGWQVSGALETGAGFTCKIDNAGRIRSLEIDLAYLGSASAAGDGQQLGDDVYARARQGRNSAYPGAPSSGEIDDRPVWTGDSESASQSYAIDGDIGG